MTPASIPLSLYVHWPWCVRKCPYCDFNSHALPQSDDIAERYIDALIADMKTSATLSRKRPLISLFIGGGTPSLMPAGLLSKIVSHIGLDGVEEATIEVNPDDVAMEYVKELADMGFNRVSMGVQSFIDSELRLLNRRHDAKGARNAVDILKRCGIQNISIDLIYGIPGQTLQSWRESIDAALSLDVPHISAYNLTYEEGTRLTMMRDKGRIKEVGDELCVDMFDALSGLLSDAGYEQYEISNFSKPGMYSRHNSSYWNFTPYLGLGASAHSFDGRKRRYNPSNLREYVKLIKEKGYAYRVEEETENQLYNEWVMTRLRTKWGLDINDLGMRFGRHYEKTAAEILEKYSGEGDVHIENGIARLTKKGIMISDMIFRDLFVV